MINEGLLTKCVCVCVFVRGSAEDFVFEMVAAFLSSHSCEHWTVRGRTHAEESTFHPLLSSPLTWCDIHYEPLTLVSVNIVVMRAVSHPATLGHLLRHSLSKHKEACSHHFLVTWKQEAEDS